MLLNHALVVGPNRFKPRVRAIERAIDVEDENRLLVRVAGKPGSGVALSVFAIDERAPTVVDVVPADGTTVSEPEVTLAFGVEDRLSEVVGAT